jgi:hypothetical protein
MPTTFSFEEATQAPDETDGGKKTFSFEEAKDQNVPQMSAYHPTLRQRASDVFHAIRTSQPVESVLGRTPEETAQMLQPRPTGLIPNVIKAAKDVPAVAELSPAQLYPEQKTVAGGVAKAILKQVNLGNLAILTGIGEVWKAANLAKDTPKIAALTKALVGAYFATQGAKIGSAAAGKLAGTPAQSAGETGEDIANIGLGSLMAFAPMGGAILSGRIKPSTKGAQNAEAIRGDTGQLRAQGQVAKGGEEAGRHDVEQTPPEQPQPVGAREEKAQAGAVALKDLPPAKKGFKRLFSGSPPNNPSSWATDDPALAAKHAQAVGGVVHYVDAPESVLPEAGRKARSLYGSPKGNYILPNDLVNQQEIVNVPSAPVHVLEETPVSKLGGAIESRTPEEQARSKKASMDMAAAMNADLMKTTEPKPDWKVVVQQPQVEGGKPFVQIVDPRQPENARSPTVETLRKIGHDVPDFTKLPTGSYSWKEAVSKVSTSGKPELIAANYKPAIKTGKKITTGTDHPDAYRNARASGIADTTGSQEGFLDNGVFKTRKKFAADHPEIPTTVEPGKTHSEDLTKIKQPVKPVAAKEPAMAEVGPGMGAAIPSEFPHPETRTTGAGQDIYGIAARVRKARADAGQVAPVASGEGIGAEDAVKWGQELIAAGVDPEKSMQEFERNHATSFDLFAMARGHGEALAKSAWEIESQFGTDSLQYRTAQKALSDWDVRSKAMQTEWHKQGMAQQGETDIDTGSFTGINREFRNTTGRDLNPPEAKQAKKIAAGVKQADDAVEPAKLGLQKEIDAVSEKGVPVKMADNLDGQRAAFGNYESGQPMNPAQVKSLWTRAKIYIDEGGNSRADTIHKIAIDFGLPEKDILRGLSQGRSVRRAADNVWQKQREARMLKQLAKQWIEHAQETWLQKALPTAARTLFSLKVGLHGTVAMGTHAPLVAATHPIIFKNNFGRMYKLVVSPDYYEMQQAALARRPNYAVAQRAGLVNDMSKLDDYSDPAIAQGFPKMAAWFKARLDRVHLGRFVGMGTRGYSVLKILRQDLFDHAWDKLAESERSPEMVKAVADSVNHITGVTRSTGGTIGRAAHYALFAPRLEASRVAVLVTDPARAINSLMKMENMTPEQKWFALNQVKEKASIFAVATGLLLANQQLNDFFGDKKKINGVPVVLGGGGWNPMQSDFMKFRVAGMNIAWGSPFLTMMRLPLRIYQIGAGSGGKTKFLIYPDESMYKTAGSYLRTQASPFASPIISLITKGDYQDRPLPQIPGYGKPPPVPKRLAAEGVKPYTWKEFGSDMVLPIPFEEGANEIFHYYDMGQSAEARNTLLKAFATVAFMAATGGRMAEDWNKPRAVPAWQEPP